MRELVLTAAMLFGLSATPALAATAIDGMWVTQAGDGQVQVGKCGPSLCGRLVKYLVPPPGGVDQRDVNNSDPSLRQRKVLGSAILSGLVQDGEVWRGQVYDPRRGKTFRAIVRRLDANRLEVKGCVGPFCQAQVWQKAR